MVQGKKTPDLTHGTKFQSSTMAGPNKDGGNARGGSILRNDSRGQNGNASSFRTDTAISGKKVAGERMLQRWQPDEPSGIDDSLEAPGSKSSVPWDQFAENNRRFGVTTDYDENIYTTTIDKSHPQYQQRRAAALKMEAEILSGSTNNAHIAEERITDHHNTKDNGHDEEDKYSGVRRQADFPPLSSTSNNKYTPPARRAPTGQSTVPGAPVDPAIISSQLARPEKSNSSDKHKVVPNAKVPKGDTEHVAVKEKALAPPAAETNPSATAAASPTTNRMVSPKPRLEAITNPPKTTNTEVAQNATATVERDVASSFKVFAAQQRKTIDQMRKEKHKADKEDKLKDLRKFADSFKLHTPVPKDLVSIIAKDPAKQKEIQEKAKRNAEEAKTTSLEAVRSPTAGGESKLTPSNQHQAAGPQLTLPAGAQARQNGPAGRGSYQQHQAGFNGRGGSQAPHSSIRTGNSNARMRGSEQKHNGPSNGMPAYDPYRAHAMVPSHTNDSQYSRRSSGVNGAQVGRLNPNSSEFRPNASASSFVPATHGSSASSPHPVSMEKRGSPSAKRSFLRRKVLSAAERPSLKDNFDAMENIKAFKVPPGKNWDANGGLKPAYETPPTWRTIAEKEPAESTMHLTYEKLFEMAPFATAMSPQMPPSIPALPHAHQLPFHLQHGMHMGMRQSPRQMPMNLHGGAHGHQHNNNMNGPNDHRMMSADSTQSFASPRSANVMSFPSPMHQSPQLAYNGPMMPYGGAPPMGPYRSMSQSQGFMPQQSHMGPMMMNNGNGFMSHQGMPPTPQLMYPQGHQGQFMPPGAGHPAGMPMNGFPSPGRSAPMMMNQGSQQGHQQAMYGMSPGLQYGSVAPIYVQPNPSQSRPGMPQM